jgi:O-antigen/teichoic acid export membrane protein
MSTLRRNASANLLGRAASTVIWILVTPFVLARLGAERFAVWALFFVLGGYAATLDLGMGSVVARYVAMNLANGDPGSARLVIRRSLLVSASLGLLWALGCVLLRADFVRWFHVPAAWAGETRTSLGLFGASLFVFSFTQLFQSSLIGFQRLHVSNLCFVAGLVVNVAVLVAGLRAGYGLMAAAAAAIAGHSVAAVLSALAVRGSLRDLGPARPVAPATWRELLGFGGIVQVTNGLIAGQAQVGKVLLGLFGRLAWVTQYEIGFRVANALWSLPTLIQAALLPAIAEASVGGDAGRVRELYLWTCRWAFTLAGWLLGGLWALAPAVLQLWLGKGGSESVVVARLLAAAFVVAIVAGPASIVARAHGWPGLETWFFGIAFALNLALGLVLVPKWAAAGAALAAAVSFALAGLWLLLVLHRRIGVGSARWFLGVALPRIGPAVVAAAAVAPLMARWATRSRGEAFVAVLVLGAAFTLLYGLLLLPCGDPAAVWARVRSRGAAVGAGA